MYNAQQVIERVQSALKNAGITQKTMLRDCGISENTLKRMNDERGMSSFYLARIADYLKVSVDYLLGRTEFPAQSMQSCNIISGNSINTGTMQTGC